MRVSQLYSKNICLQSISFEDEMLAVRRGVVYRIHERRAFMAFSLNKNFCGSATGTISVPAALQDYVSDWAVTEESTDSCTISCIKNAVDKPATCKITTQKINNCYKNSNISVANRAPVTSATRFILSYHGVWSETDAELGISYDAPVACSITCTVPDWAIVTPADVISLIAQNLGFAFEASDSSVGDSTRIRRLLRGAERPIGL